MSTVTHPRTGRHGRSLTNRAVLANDTIDLAKATDAGVGAHNRIRGNRDGAPQMCIIANRRVTADECLRVELAALPEIGTTGNRHGIGDVGTIAYGHRLVRPRSFPRGRREPDSPVTNIRMRTNPDIGAQRHILANVRRGLQSGRETELRPTVDDRARPDCHHRPQVHVRHHDRASLEPRAGGERGTGPDDRTRAQVGPRA